MNNPNHTPAWLALACIHIVLTLAIAALAGGLSSITEQRNSLFHCAVHSTSKGIPTTLRAPIPATATPCGTACAHPSAAVSTRPPAPC